MDNVNWSKISNAGISFVVAIILALIAWYSAEYANYTNPFTQAIIPFFHMIVIPLIALTVIWGIVEIKDGLGIE